MKVFDKIKDLFTDEEEEIIETPVRKEVIQVEIPAPKAQPKVEKEEEPEEEPKKLQDTNVFFDELDFDDIKNSDATLDELYKGMPTHKEEKKEIYKEAYASKKAEPKKHFEPTPIISPVYGVLDKNYKKDDIVDRSERPVSHKDMTVDDVRNKAYGTLEDELENTLFGRTAILFQEKDKKEEYNDLEEDLDKTAAAIDLIEEAPKHVKKVELDEPVVEEKEIVYDDTVDDLVSEALNDDAPEKEEVKETKREKDETISENELFNLIDDIYGEGGK